MNGKFVTLTRDNKVFIEYCPAEKAWMPVTAPGYLMINCLWVSGQYKAENASKGPA